MTDPDDPLSRHAERLPPGPTSASSGARQTAVRRRRVRATAVGLAAVVAVVGAGAVVLTVRGGDAAGVSQAAVTPAVTTASATPSLQSLGPGVVRGRVAAQEKLREPAQKVIFYPVAPAQGYSAPVENGSYEIRLPPGTYQVSVDTGSDGYVVTTSLAGDRCLDVVVVTAGQQQDRQLNFPCRKPLPPASVAATPRDPRVAPGIKADPALKLARTDDFGLITSVTPQPDGSLKITFDRVDWLGGNEAAVANGGGAPPNDYFVRNVNPALRTYTVAPTAEVWGSILLSRKVDPTRSSVAALARFVQSDPALGSAYWHLQLDGGVVTGVEEQYHP